MRPVSFSSLSLCFAAMSLAIGPLAAEQSELTGPLPAPRHAVFPDGTAKSSPLLLVPQGNMPSAKAFPDVEEPAPTAQWTILLYIGGDNDLEAWVVKDIEEELGLIGSTDEVQLVALADRIPGYDDAGGDWTGSRLFHIERNQSAEDELADLGELNFGSSETLSDFISWGKAQYPAENYALVFWDHGWGWRPSQTMLDYSNRDSLDQHEVVEALEQAGPVELIAWDACMMATLEVQASVQPYADAMVGSEDYVAYSGFRYEEILMELIQNPEIPAQELAVLFSQSMRDRTASAVSLGEDWHGVMASVNTLAEALVVALPTHRDQIDRARELSQIFGDPMNKDLYDIAFNLYNEVDDEDVRRASEEVMSASDQVRLHEWHRSVYESAHGTTLYWPSHRRDMWSRYSQNVVDFDYYNSQLKFSEASKWDDFLRAYVRAE